MNITADKDVGRAVRVIWTDSGFHHDEGWAPIETFMAADVHAMRVETVGIWMGENEEVIAVAQSRDEDNCNWLAAQIILKSCVVKKEWLS